MFLYNELMTSRRRSIKLVHLYARVLEISRLGVMHRFFQNILNF